ncbi:MAG: ferrochelatase [Acidimicrobiales bacterium]
MFDAILLHSFGGPEGPDDVVPFLENVTRGRGIPRERLAQVGEHYFLFGGKSPINDQNRALIAALRTELDAAGIDLPIYWGNRNWEPYLRDTVAEMIEAGHQRVLVVATSAFGSQSGCRQYREDLAEAVATLDGTIELQKVPPYWNHPGFLDAMADRLDQALASLGDRRSDARIVFTAHSIPTAWTETAPYVGQLRAAATHLVDRVAPDADWDLVYQSRSGPPQVPWLEPDIVDHLESLHDAGVDVVAVTPLGFVSDHMEVVYDLDTEAAARAAELSMTMVRTPTVGTHRAFVSGLADLIGAAIAGRDRLVVVAEPAGPTCGPGCCVIARRPG